MTHPPAQSPDLREQNKGPTMLDRTEGLSEVNADLRARLQAVRGPLAQLEFHVALDPAATKMVREAFAALTHEAGHGE